MCTSTPDVPTVPERQSAKLPDQGAPAGATRNNTFRRALLAGLMTPMTGLGSPTIGKPTLG